MTAMKVRPRDWPAPLAAGERAHGAAAEAGISLQQDAKDICSRGEVLQRSSRFERAK
jgi:hypothetical protein